MATCSMGNTDRILAILVPIEGEKPSKTSVGLKGVDVAGAN